eukprot:CAMPEP_0113853272 /NCGR_PEP_ID=MMETSP0372-20130328/6229_1 /TAXON_ID=340204 /ORGANISM="Lankesteria abbotti" /LENGTH=353 /DNA_ID=CAMNT_0000825425 /DNA_START=433 /DNA_END=1494 /DNA_ORIENTATION=- /assembly_acc=CAM_ASM_000359
MVVASPVGGSDELRVGQASTRRRHAATLAQGFHRCAALAADTHQPRTSPQWTNKSVSTDLRISADATSPRVTSLRNIDSQVHRSFTVASPTNPVQHHDPLLSFDVYNHIVAQSNKSLLRRPLSPQSPSKSVRRAHTHAVPTTPTVDARNFTGGTSRGNGATNKNADGTTKTTGGISKVKGGTMSGVGGAISPGTVGAVTHVTGGTVTSGVQSLKTFGGWVVTDEKPPLVQPTAVQRLPCVVHPHKHPVPLIVSRVVAPGMRSVYGDGVVTTATGRSHQLMSSGVPAVLSSSSSNYEWPVGIEGNLSSSSRKCLSYDGATISRVVSNSLSLTPQLLQSSRNERPSVATHRVVML